MCDFPWVFSCGVVKKVWHCSSKVRISISIWCEHTLSKSPVLLIALFSWVATVLLWVFMPPLLHFVLAIEDYSVSTLYAELTQIWLVLPQSDRAWASAFEGCFTRESWFYDPCWDNEIEIFLGFFFLPVTTHSSVWADVPPNVGNTAAVKAYSCLVCLPLQ